MALTPTNTTSHEGDERLFAVLEEVDGRRAQEVGHEHAFHRAGHDEQVEGNISR